MLQRAIDFKNVLCAVPDADFNTPNTPDWFQQWTAYVKTGGDRPPINPTHP